MNNDSPTSLKNQKTGIGCIHKSQKVTGPELSANGLRLAKIVGMFCFGVVFCMFF